MVRQFIKLQRYIKCIAAIMLAFAVFVYVTGCNAPHDNPYDPQSQAYDQPQPPDRITDLSIDSIYGHQCRISWTEPADADEYRLYYGPIDWNAQSRDGATEYASLIQFTRSGVHTSTVLSLTDNTYAWAIFSISAEGLWSQGSNVIIIEPEPEDSPASIDFSVYSIHSDTWAWGHRYWLAIEANITDVDGLLMADAMFDTLAFGSLQPVNRDSVQWILQLEEGELYDMFGFLLSGLSAYRVPINLVTTDRLGFETESDPKVLHRVIEDIPSIKSPDFDTLSTGTNVEIIWEKFDAGYEVFYRIEITHVATSGFSEVIYSIDGINASDSSHVVQVQLPVTDPDELLYWVLTVYDEFGDESRSLPTQFWIE